MFLSDAEQNHRTKTWFKFTQAVSGRAGIKTVLSS